MAYARLRIGPQGRIVIPATLRRELHIVPGDELTASVDGSKLILQTPEQLIAEIQDEIVAAKGDRSLVDELIAERRAEAAREAQW